MGQSKNFGSEHASKEWLASLSKNLKGPFENFEQAVQGRADCWMADESPATIRASRKNSDEQAAGARGHKVDPIFLIVALLAVVPPACLAMTQILRSEGRNIDGGR
jgi:hypothetical protein